MDIQLIYVTFPDEQTALTLGSELVERGLTACFNLHVIRSVYPWKGKIEDETEWVALFKTTSAQEEALRVAIEKGHPYEVPCILSWVAAANDCYGDWVTRCLSSFNSPPPSDAPVARP